MIVFLFLIFLLMSPFAHADAIGIQTGAVSPDFSLNTIDGNTVSLSDHKGKVVILLYWRPDQERSVLALQDCQDIFKAYKGKGVQVISLIPGSEDKDAAQGIMKEKAIDVPVLIDADRQVYGSYGLKVFPTTILVSREGRVSYDMAGHPLDYKANIEGNLQLVLGQINEDKLKDMLSPHRETQDKSLREAERWYNLAMKFTDERLFDQAIDAAKKSIETKSDLAKSHILLGFLFLQSKDADKASGEFNRAIELDPASHDARTGSGSTLLLKGELDKAIEVLTSASMANPYPQMAFFELGKAYELKGDKDKAIEMYKRAIEKIINKKVLPSSISKCE